MTTDWYEISDAYEHTTIFMMAKYYWWASGHGPDFDYEDEDNQ